MKRALALCLFLCACGGKAGQFTPDQSSFEAAVDTYIAALEHAKESYASDLFSGPEREAQLLGLREDLQLAQRDGLSFKVLSANAEPLPNRDDAYVITITRRTYNKEGAEVGKPKSALMVFVFESDGKWRISMKETNAFRAWLASRAAARPPANAPANVPGNPPANSPANAPAHGGG